jgi:hypothetical protein
MAEISFHSPKAKLERAYERLAEVESRVASFTASSKHRIVVQKDPATGRTRVVLESAENVPVEINLAFGDCVHNLRSALDHLMGLLVLKLVPGADPDHIYFPIRENEKALISALKDGKVGKAMATPIGQKIGASIVNDLKPYGALDNPFRALTKLDNIDKHRLLLTVSALAGVTFDGRIGSNYFSGCSARSKLGSNSVLIDSDLGMECNLQPTFDVLIAEPELPPNQSLIPMLKSLAEVVCKAIESIEKWILTSAPKT